MQSFFLNMLKNTAKLDVFRVASHLVEAISKSSPFSLVRLGDGEGALMGYGQFTTRKDVNRSLKTWFGHTNINDEDICFLSSRLNQAIASADLIGLPRQSQVNKHALYESVWLKLQSDGLPKLHQYTTDSAIHRYLQFTLLFRLLLFDLPFVGTVGARDLSAVLQENFNVKRTKTYLIKGEANHPGTCETNHWPDGYQNVMRDIHIPFEGAVFLVGAGALGKIYCDEIKRKGGIAIDIGALFDAWTGVQSRLVNPIHAITNYKTIPQITREQAVARFNYCCDHFNIDTPRLALENITLKRDIW